ncbi:MAG TPA: transglycosylase SLT domain-containing protein [Acidobacteriota bacterium]|nr:transglycosylase SLT domain-containing protein [Acidobacteriota bacterium]
MISLAKTAPSLLKQTGLDRLKTQQAADIEQEKARLREATREFESFFMYYLLKNMRKTIPKNELTRTGGLSESMGSDVFTDLFDMEVARKITRSNNRSIAEMLYQSLEKQTEARFGQPGPTPDAAPGISPEPKGLKLDRDHIELPNRDDRQIPRPDAVRSLPVSQGPRRVRHDPILAKYGPDIYRAAAETKLDSALIASVIRAESNGDARAVSTAGARGLMQLTDTTAREMGVTDVFDPAANIRGGSRYLRQLIDRYGDVKLALAAYNAGPGNVDRYKGVPPFKETRRYVARVIRLMAAHTANSSASNSKVSHR